VIVVDQLVVVAAQQHQVVQARRAVIEPDRPGRRHRRGARQPRRQQLAQQRHPRGQVGGLLDPAGGLRCIEQTQLLQQPPGTAVAGLLRHPEPFELGDVLEQPEVLDPHRDQACPRPVERLPLDRTETSLAHVFESRADPRHRPSR
jgi:hypothetical protein